MVSDPIDQNHQHPPALIQLVKDRLQPGEQEDQEDNFVEPLFQTALHIVQSSLPRTGPIQPTYNDKLLLYSLFKQAVIGDVKTSSVSRPGIFDMLGRAKWDAWRAREGLSSLEAKKLYIESVLKILRSHRERPEARKLLELLHTYEVYSTQTDQMSEYDEDPDSVTRLAINSTDGDSNHPDDQEIAEGIEPTAENYQMSPENQDRSDGDLESSRLGPYISSSQLPDPIKLPDFHQVLPPHSPETCHSRSERTSDSSHPSLSLEDRPSSGTQESLQVKTHEHDADQSVGSEPKFTPDQVQTLINLTPQTFHTSYQAPPLPRSNGSFQVPNSHHLIPPPPEFANYHPPPSSSYDVLVSKIQKLNQSIDDLHTLISNAEHLNVLRSTPIGQVYSKTGPTHDPPAPHQAPHPQQVKALIHSLIHQIRLSPVVRLWFKRVFLDLSVLFFLLRALRFLQRKKS